MNDELFKICIQGAILKTVAFFDLFDYPLTLAEIHKFLYLPEARRDQADRPAPLSFILGIIEEFKVKNLIGEKNGFYFLRGREGVIGIRLSRYLSFNRKIEKAKRIIKFFSFLPWIKMVGIGNMIGSNNLKEDSDIDFFIITRPGKIWTARLFCNLITQALNLRPKTGRMKDKICLSFFVAGEEFNLKNFSFEDDIYFCYWIAGLAPVYERGAAYKKFIKANSFLTGKLPNWQPAETVKWARVEASPASVLAGKIISIFAFGLESLARQIQRRYFPLSIREKLNMGTEVVANDKLVKLHTNDRRKAYRDEWKKGLEKLKID